MAFERFSSCFLEGFLAAKRAWSLGTWDGKSTDFAPSLRSMLLGTTSRPQAINSAGKEIVQGFRLRRRAGKGRRARHPQ